MLMRYIYAEERSVHKARAPYGNVQRILGETLQKMPDDLFPVGGHQIRRSRVLIEQSYEGVMDRAARLVSFGTSKPIDSETGIEKRQERQTVDDILMFAIHARRLITAAGAVSLANNVSVGLWEFGGTQTDIRFVLSPKIISIWKFLGVVVHYELLEVVRYKLQVKYLLRVNLHSTFDEIFSGPHKYNFPSKIFIKSDKNDAIIVDILQMTNLFLEKILHPIMEICEDHEIYLETDYLERI